MAALARPGLQIICADAVVGGRGDPHRVAVGPEAPRRVRLVEAIEPGCFADNARGPLRGDMRPGAEPTSGLIRRSGWTWGTNPFGIKPNINVACRR